MIAILLENNPRYLEITWVAPRAELYFVCIRARLQASEVAYIVEDSGAKVLVTSSAIKCASELQGVLDDVRLAVVGAAQAAFVSFDDERAKMPATPVDDETEGKAKRT